MVKVNVHTGCCAAYNFYDIGSAHGIQRAKDLEDFVSRFDNFGPNTMNTIFLNSDQTVEARWLLELGWVLSAQYGSISLFTISRSGFNQFKNKFHAIREKKIAEERALREKERAEAREKLKRDPKPDQKVTIDFVKKVCKSRAPQSEDLKFLEDVFKIQFNRRKYQNWYELYESLKSLVAHKKRRERETKRIKNGTTG